MAGWLYLCIALCGAALVLNAARPRTTPYVRALSWVLAFVTTDLAFFHIALAALLSIAFWAAGAFQATPGRLGLFVVVASSLALLRLWWPSLRAATTAGDVARELQLVEVDPVPRRLLLAPLPVLRDGVTVMRDIEFSRATGRSLRMDIYRGYRNSGKRPALVFLHGGAWILGDKREQGLPLCHHLAALGWVCANANYRLSPAATYPDQVVDARKAVAWIRRHADEYGVDPRFVAIAGASAGAHIAAMAALAPHSDPQSATAAPALDSVQAVVTFYGVYDLTDRLGLHGRQFVNHLIGRQLLKAFFDTEPERFHAASPRDHVDRVAAPWLLLHGERDTLVPVAEARDFAQALARRSDHAVGYAEFPGAQHAFDIYYSLRAIAAVELTARFLVTAYRAIDQRATESA